MYACVILLEVMWMQQIAGGAAVKYYVIPIPMDNQTTVCVRMCIVFIYLIPQTEIKDRDTHNQK